VTVDLAVHPLINALLNAASGILLFCGWRAIRAKRPKVHKRLMLSAFAVSSVFLVSYLIRVAVEGTHPFPGEGALKAFYLALLGSHMALAATVPVLAISSIAFALKGNLDRHRRWVRFTLPIWGYVSATGVLVYLMLYHLPA
jgi:putative membrane protein